MKRSEVLKRFIGHESDLKKLGVKALAFFGSSARDEAHADSDVDVVVEFVRPARFEQYMDLKFYLEGLLDRPVDLVTYKALKPRLRPEIEKEAVHVPGF